MQLCCVVCLVCGLLATCVFVFLAYRYLLSSSGETEVEHQDLLVIEKETKMSSSKVSDSGGIPASVLSGMSDVSVQEKTATFTVNGRV